MAQLEHELAELKDSKFRSECREAATDVDLDAAKNRVKSLESANLSLVNEVAALRGTQSELHGELSRALNREAELEGSVGEGEDSVRECRENTAQVRLQIYTPLSVFFFWKSNLLLRFFCFLLVFFPI